MQHPRIYLYIDDLQYCYWPIEYASRLDPIITHLTDKGHKVQIIER